MSGSDDEYQFLPIISEAPESLELSAPPSRIHTELWGEPGSLTTGASPIKIRNLKFRRGQSMKC